MEPYFIVDIVRQIMNHERFPHLDSVTQIRIDTIDGYIMRASNASIKRDDRAYLREVWRYLYTGGPFPEG